MHACSTCHLSMHMHAVGCTTINSALTLVTFTFSWDVSNVYNSHSSREQHWLFKRHTHLTILGPHSKWCSIAALNFLACHLLVPLFTCATSRRSSHPTAAYTYLRMQLKSCACAPELHACRADGKPELQWPHHAYWLCQQHDQYWGFAHKTRILTNHCWRGFPDFT